MHEAQLHVAIYAGVSVPNHAIKVAKQTDLEMDVAGGHDRTGEQMICNSRPETGAIYTRAQTSHPAAFSPEHKSGNLRSRQRNRVSFWKAISGINVPMFDHSLTGDLDSDLTDNYAAPGQSMGSQRIIIDRVLDERGRPVSNVLREVWQPNVGERKFTMFENRMEGS